MAKRHPRVITWDGDRGTAPDGTEYEINGEQIRGEPRAYWAMAWIDGHLVDVEAIHESGWPTKDRAKQDAEAHYRAKTAKETS